MRYYQKENFWTWQHDCETFNFITHILYVQTQTYDHMSYDSPCSLFSQSKTFIFEENNNWMAIAVIMKL